jgi:group I intron endonuclease
MNTKYVIYKIENVINKKCYIGCSKNVDNRFYEHKWDLRNNHHHNVYLQRSWNKYGEDSFTFNIIECPLSEEYMYEREFELIDKTDDVYNIASGGTGGNTRRNFSEEQHKEYSKNRSIAMRKYYDNGGKAVNAFHTASEERRAELSKIWSDARKGLKNPNCKYFDKVIQSDKEDNLIRVWDNIYQIGEETDYTTKYIIRCCKDNKRYKSHKGYKWAFDVCAG